MWVVGASSGIGAELARELDRRGARVAITARRRDRLEEVAEHRMVVAPADVTDADGLAAAAADVTDALGGLDMVIWCAGYWKQSDATKWDAAEFARHVEVNLLGLSALLAAVLPGMVARGRGHIVGVASVAGFRGLPGAEAYGATKAAQLNLLESLRVSLRAHGVQRDQRRTRVRAHRDDRRQHVPDAVPHRRRPRRADHRRRTRAAPHRDRVPAADGRW